MKRRREFRLRIVLALVLTGCSSQAAKAPVGTPSHSVTQGGPQDIAEFRKVVEEGKVPASALLDPVGFFAEHGVDLPAPDCGAALCPHPMLAVAPRFDGGNWTMAFVGLNTAVDPGTLPGAPRHLILVLETSPATQSILITARQISDTIVPYLRADDRVTVIQTGAAPPGSNRVLGIALAPDKLASLQLLPLSTAQHQVEIEGSYEGLVRAYEIALDPEFQDDSQHVLWLTNGTLDRNVTDDTFADLADRFAAQRIPISSFGMGDGYQGTAPRLLAEISSGNYYFAQTWLDLEDALTAEAKTGFVTLASDLALTIRAAAGYHIGRVYGARSTQKDTGEAVLSSPAVFVGTRTGQDIGMGDRRGGGGGWFVELVADATPSDAPEPAAPVFELATTFVESSTGATREFDEQLMSPFGVGQNPSTGGAFFSDEAHAKPFMMLNMYLALKTMLKLYEAGNCGAALGVQGMMKRSYEFWQKTYSDADIDQDYWLMGRLTDAIRSSCSQMEAEPSPVEVKYSCFLT